MILLSFDHPEEVIFLIILSTDGGTLAISFEEWAEVVEFFQIKRDSSLVEPAGLRWEFDTHTSFDAKDADDS